MQPHPCHSFIGQQSLQAEIATCSMLSTHTILLAVLSLLQIAVGSHRFTYDNVYGSGGGDRSANLYPDCVQPLVDGLFKGYNATVFAYGESSRLEVLLLLSQKLPQSRGWRRTRGMCSSRVCVCSWVVVQQLNTCLFLHHCRCCCSCTGQTGSGKTYTMGSAWSPEEEVEGVIPSVMDELFTRVETESSTDFTIKVSFVEIHKVRVAP